MKTYKKYGYADISWNPLTGCTNSCEFCWARPFAHRLKKMGIPAYQQDNPFAPAFHPKRLDEPSKWRKPQIVACNFMGEMFDPERSGRHINRFWMMTFNNPKHQYLLLTKQPDVLLWWTKMAAKFKHWPIEDIWPDWFWLGLTITNQQDADEKLPIFLQIPGKKWLSIEPCISKIELTRWLNPDTMVTERGFEHEGKRKGVFGASGNGLVQCKHCGGDYNKTSEVNGWEQNRDKALYENAKNRNKGREIRFKESSKGIVYRGDTAENGGLCSQNNLDDSQQCRNPQGAGNKSHRRESEEQSSQQPRGGNEKRKLCSCGEARLIGEVRPKRGKEQFFENKQFDCAGNTGALQNEVNDSGKNSQAIQSFSNNGKQHSPQKNMGTHPKIDQVIVGGMSGPLATPMHPDWVRKVRDDCAAAGVPFFFKSWGEWATVNSVDLETVTTNGWHRKKVGKKAAGRLLDGREHNDLIWGEK